MNALLIAALLLGASDTESVCVERAEAAYIEAEQVGWYLPDYVDAPVPDAVYEDTLAACEAGQ